MELGHAETGYGSNCLKTFVHFNISTVKVKYLALLKHTHAHTHTRACVWQYIFQGLGSSDEYIINLLHNDGEILRFVLQLNNKKKAELIYKWNNKSTSFALAALA